MVTGLGSSFRHCFRKSFFGVFELFNFVHFVTAGLLNLIDIYSVCTHLFLFQALFSKTKYLIVDLLKIQRGETFTAILHSAANTQQQVLNQDSLKTFLGLLSSNVKSIVIS